MGFAIHSGGGLLAPLASWVARRAAMYAIPGGADRPAKPAIQIAAPIATAPAPRPLRVLKVADGSARHCAGRMVITGRMADVCAELDRLAAREAVATRPHGIA